MDEEQKKAVAQAMENVDLQKCVDMLGSGNEVLLFFKRVFANPANPTENAVAEVCLAGIEKGLKRLEDEKRASDVEALIAKAKEDILIGMNIAEWSKDIELAITEVDKLIGSSEQKESFEALKNHLFSLKYLIAEVTP